MVKPNWEGVASITAQLRLLNIMSPATRAIAMSMHPSRRVLHMPLQPLRLRPAAGAAAAAAPVAPWYPPPATYPPSCRRHTSSLPRRQRRRPPLSQERPPQLHFVHVECRTHVGQAAPGLPTFLAVLHVGDGDFEGLKLLVSEKVERLVNRWCREAEEEPLEEGTELVAALLVGGSREAHDDEELHAALQADAEGYATAAVLTCAPHQLAPRAGEALGSFPLSNGCVVVRAAAAPAPPAPPAKGRRGFWRLACYACCTVAVSAPADEAAWRERHAVQKREAARQCEQPLQNVFTEQLRSKHTQHTRRRPPGSSRHALRTPLLAGLPTSAFCGVTRSERHSPPMPPARVPPRRRLPIECAGVCALAYTVLEWVPRIPQPPSYHSFADQREFLGIPHALNVLSNAAIAVPGVFGLLVLVVSAARSLSRRAPQPPSDDAADPCWAASCVGMLLTAAGSAYYHLAPDTPRLAWDRLGMAVAFASLFAAALAERRIRSRDGATMALALLLATAGGSVAHWRTSEEEGRGDLRAYALVQGLSALGIGYVAVSYPPPPGSAAERSGSTRALLRALAWYAAAIVCDRTDWIIYKLTAQVVSGHTLKHLLAGVAGWEVVRMLRARASVAGAV